MSEISGLYVAAGQGAIFDGDNPALVGWSPHSRHCEATAQRSTRHCGEYRHICVTACPRKAQFEKYVLSRMTVDVELLDVSFPQGL